MHPPTQPDSARIRDLAQSLACITVEDFCLLAKITEGTAEHWRKHGKGPPYVLIGNQYLYPRQPLAEFLRSKVRERRTVAAKGLL